MEKSLRMFEARFTMATKLGWSLVQAYPPMEEQVNSDNPATRELAALHASYYDVRPPTWSHVHDYTSLGDTVYTWAGLDIAVPSYFWDDRSFQPLPFIIGDVIEEADEELVTTDKTRLAEGGIDPPTSGL